MAVKKSPEEKFILSYFDRLNIIPSRSWDEFFSYLSLNHGKSVANELENIIEARADELEGGEKLYDLKNQNLRLSLDFTRYSADLYRRYFQWLMKNKDINPGRVLDLGCDNGIVTCFYGLLYPEAEIVGIDVSENGIKCSEELKQKLNLSNVSFKNMDVQDLEKCCSQGQFDMISSVRSLHEIIDFPEFGKHWSLYELDSNNVDGKTSKVLSIIKNLLNKETGLFITWERLSDIEDYMWWIKSLKNEGLYAELEKVSKIEFHELGDVQKMPIIVASRQEQEGSCDEKILLSFIKGKNIDITSRQKYDEDIAEVVFLLHKDKELITGFQTNPWDKLNTERVELWKDRDLLLAYRYSNQGYRELNIFDLEALDMVKQDLKTAERIFRDSGKRIFWYGTVEEREKLG